MLEGLHGLEEYRKVCGIGRKQEWVRIKKTAGKVDGLRGMQEDQKDQKNTGKVDSSDEFEKSWELRRMQEYGWGL